MELYLAPMEGITGYIYRQAYETVFTPLDKYFTPFINANLSGKFSSREWEDICPEHNQGRVVIPQILTNRSEDFIATTQALKALGYKEVNLNLGCPSGTVVSKNKGSGFLAHKEQLKYFLEEIFQYSDLKISIKTRIGKEDSSEFPDIMAIYNQYPLSELIIHPRVQKDYYKNKPRLLTFKEAFYQSPIPICYNGDIFTLSDYYHIKKECPELQKIMLGRGLIANPGLAREIIGQPPMSLSEVIQFHDCLFEGYHKILSGERNVLFKMKECWFYMGYMFTQPEKYMKKIRKAQHFRDYELAVQTLFEEQTLQKGAGLFTLPS